MVVFKTVCVECNQAVELPVNVVSVRAVEGQYRWAYRCPSCGTHIVRAADDDTLALLEQGGVVPTDDEPAPMPTIEGKTPTGPPISEDDVIAFGLALEATS